MSQNKEKLNEVGISPVSWCQVHLLINLEKSSKSFAKDATMTRGKSNDKKKSTSIQ